MKYKYLFGPVPSRRLGVSLGVDLVPYKVCTFNCIYCECGKTTDFTQERKPFFDADRIIEELRDFLIPEPELDYITFSGGGEPTLNSDTGKILNFIKDSFPAYKVALLTNGSLLWKEDVRDDIKKCDIILPSLDAVSEGVFKKINRPCIGIEIKDIVKGIKKIKEESSARIWLEVFIVPGINDRKEELKLLKDTITEIGPEKVQLNTLDRPPTEEYVMPASREKMQEIKDFFMPVKAEIIKDFVHKGSSGEYLSDIEEKFLSILRRRPCTAEDLSGAFELQTVIINKYLRELEKSGRIISEKRTRGVFYRLKENGTEKKKN